MKSKPAKKRLDLLLVDRGLAESATKAQAMILAGEVSVDNVRANKAGAPVSEGAHIAVTSRTQKYASRGGFKLEGALALGSQYRIVETTRVRPTSTSIFMKRLISR